MTFYKLTTISPCTADVFLEFVRARGIAAHDDGDCNPLAFVDDTGSVYRIKFVDDRSTGYVSFDGTVLIDGHNVVFGHISRFVCFCAKHDLGLRRHKVEVPPNDGFLLSDITHSRAYREAAHAADHPNDHS